MSPDHSPTPTPLTPEGPKPSSSPPGSPKPSSSAAGSSTNRGSQPSRLTIGAIVVAVGAWLAVVFAWLFNAFYGTIQLDAVGLSGRFIRSEWLYDSAFGLAAFCGASLLVAGRRRSGVARYARYSFAFPLLWQASVYFSDRFYFPFVRVKLADFGLAALFIIGLCWIIWYVERRWREHVRYSHGREAGDDKENSRRWIWNPFHPRAWYYGRRNAKLHQSLAILTNYSLLFFAACLLSSQLSGCEEINELPAGGGKPVQRVQKVNVKKTIVKKLIFNPFSSILMSTPPIDTPNMDLNKLTKKLYEIGDGEGEGAGLGGKSLAGKVHFYRLEYPGGDWHQDMELNPDLNMLIAYHVQTGHKVAEQPEVMQISRLGNFKLGFAPPLVYMTGQKQISLSKGDVQTLRKYLIDNHGMLFIDQGGSGFDSQASAMMQQIVPNIQKVKVPMDDPIHTIPNEMGAVIPVVAPHGGREAWGWRHEGRWIAYFHPGDIGDAWADGHSGVRREVYEACYNLGVNVMLYAGIEYAKWRRARGFQ